jgi:hypothetical protein
MNVERLVWWIIPAILLLAIGTVSEIRVSGSFVYAVPATALAAILALHGFRIQKYMYLPDAGPTNYGRCAAFCERLESSDRLCRWQYALVGAIARA